MRPIMIAVLMATAFTCQAYADDPVSAADRTAIDQVITAQIEAFRHDDGNTAFGLAAPSIQQKFGTGSRFLDIVRNAYPPVFRPRSFTFGELRSEAGSITQKVAIVGPDGLAALAQYDMEHEPDGTWRIAGCVLLEGQQLSI